MFAQFKVLFLLQVTMKGLTGEIKFDQEGFRTNFNLYIMELVEEGSQQVGTWDPLNGAKFNRSVQPEIPENEFSLRNKTLKVVIALVIHKNFIFTVYLR